MKPELAQFQEQLLISLADGVPTPEIRSAAAALAPDEVMAKWVAGWDADLVDLAGLLVRTWAYRADG